MNETALDLVREAGASIRARRLRILLTSSGIALGVAASLGVTSVAEAAAASIKTRLEKVAVTTITLRLDVSTQASPTHILRRAERNLMGLTGVTGVGASIDLDKIVHGVTANPNLASVPTHIPVLAVSPSYPTAVEALGPATRPEQLFIERGARGALAGRLVPGRLDLDALSSRQAVLLAGRPFEIVATSDAGAIDTRVDESILVPLDAARELGWLDYGIDEAIVVVRTEPGRAQELVNRAQLLAWPEKPDLVGASVSADPRQLRAGIEADTLILVGGVSLLLVVLGVFSIANVMLADVMARISEIGLRRALGASRTVIGVLLLLESSAIGLLGGLAGSALGTAAAVGASLVQDWPVSIVPVRVAIAPVAGAVIGGIAGLYPAIRAARIDPATTLRGL
jgi:putative ABC transport system permease protein